MQDTHTGNVRVIQQSDKRATQPSARQSSAVIGEWIEVEEYYDETPGSAAVGADTDAELRRRAAETAEAQAHCRGLQAMASDLKTKLEESVGKLSYAHEANKALSRQNEELVEKLEAEESKNRTLVDKIERLDGGGDVSAALTAALSDVDKLESDNCRLKARCRTLEAEAAALRDTERTLRTNAEDAEMRLTVLQGDDVFVEKEALKTQNGKLEDQLGYLSRVVERLRSYNAVLESNVSELTRENKRYTELVEPENKLLHRRLAELETELSLLRAGGATASGTDVFLSAQEHEALAAATASVASLSSELVAAREEAAALKRSLFDATLQRRALHNKIQELRGNVRVVARVRPFCRGDRLPANSTSPITCNVDEESLLIQTNEALGEALYTFNRVFGPQTTQKDVFDDVAQFVQSALDGYNVCLFSYGQTGSGKTHTMRGDGAGDHRGIIPRAVEQVLACATEMQPLGWEYSFSATFVEIYNETLRDLLDPTGTQRPDEERGMPLSIHHYEDIGTRVRGALCAPATDAAELLDLIDTAWANRAVGCTDMNEQSSRSHTIFTLHISGRNAARGAEVLGTLNLCDLAGSERLDRSNATGVRLKETQNVNKSLACLSNVFVALSHRTPHVPYRDSKLTYLLQQCFSGDGKTLMVINLSPTPESAPESLCSLRFAAKVNETELGQAKKKVRALGGRQAPPMKYTAASLPVREPSATPRAAPARAATPSRAGTPSRVATATGVVRSGTPSRVGTPTRATTPTPRMATPSRTGTPGPRAATPSRAGTPTRAAAVTPTRKATGKPTSTTRPVTPSRVTAGTPPRAATPGRQAAPGSPARSAAASRVGSPLHKN